MLKWKGVLLNGCKQLEHGNHSPKSFPGKIFFMFPIHFIVQYYGLGFGTILYFFGIWLWKVYF